MRRRTRRKDNDAVVACCPFVLNVVVHVEPVTE